MSVDPAPGSAPGAQREIDVKKYAKVEKIPGGAIEDSRVLRGVMFEKDVVAPGRMRRCGAWGFVGAGLWVDGWKGRDGGCGV